MSSIPYILSLADDLNRIKMAVSPFYHHHHHHNHQDVDPYFINRNPYMALMPRELQVRNRDKNQAGPVSTVGKDGFQVCMDVAQFKPSELNVKVVDNTVVVEGKHEEREDDHGYISRHFVRRYALPKGYDADKVLSTLSSDGVLTVTVPKPPAVEDKSNERIVQIQQVGPAHLNVKENPRLEDIGEDKDAD